MLLEIISHMINKYVLYNFYSTTFYSKSNIMETISRKNKYLDYIKYYKKLWSLKDKYNNYVYTTKQSMFNKKLLSSGIEGKIYKANLKNKTQYLLFSCKYILLIL